ncbi:hypothetical protein SEMRO_1780_G297040.1 [Seminavis robusta]|uniref:Uncharacterized protein n=1 Tax=Seminavis robusta TaxID=568900 RepID=A0A9N8ES10_9STRA|nr:hypothetical protein SEMRO_1780_G297040.1 [Seminavis robusta]|eukprot:Sro1780_g297040.1 n/a (643) ;mRNA; r:14529-16710
MAKEKKDAPPFLFVKDMSVVASIKSDFEAGRWAEGLSKMPAAFSLKKGVLGRLNEIVNSRLRVANSIKTDRKIRLSLYQVCIKGIIQSILKHGISPLINQTKFRNLNYRFYSGGRGDLKIKPFWKVPTFAYNRSMLPREKSNANHGMTGIINMYPEKVRSWLDFEALNFQILMPLVKTITKGGGKIQWRHGIMPFEEESFDALYPEDIRPDVFIDQFVAGEINGDDANMFPSWCKHFKTILYGNKDVIASFDDEDGVEKVKTPMKGTKDDDGEMEDDDDEDYDGDGKKGKKKKGGKAGNKKLLEVSFSDDPGYAAEKAFAKSKNLEAPSSPERENGRTLTITGAKVFESLAKGVLHSNLRPSEKGSIIGNLVASNCISKITIDSSKLGDLFVRQQKPASKLLQLMRTVAENPEHATLEKPGKGSGKVVFEDKINNTLENLEQLAKWKVEEEDSEGGKFDDEESSSSERNDELPIVITVAVPRKGISDQVENEKEDKDSDDDEDIPSDSTCSIVNPFDLSLSDYPEAKSLVWANVLHINSRFTKKKDIWERIVDVANEGGDGAEPTSLTSGLLAEVYGENVIIAMIGEWLDETVLPVLKAEATKLIRAIVELDLEIKVPKATAVLQSPPDIAGVQKGSSKSHC